MKKYVPFNDEMYSEAVDWELTEWESRKELRRSRLYSCSATVVETEDRFFLVSYCTVVASYFKSDGGLMIYDFYSNTTQHHIRKFIRWLEENGNPVDLIEYCYIRSDRLAYDDREHGEKVYFKTV